MKKTILIAFLIIILVLLFVRYVRQPCIENWSCTGWSECINNKQTRTCIDKNNCGTVINKPGEMRFCDGKVTSRSEIIADITTDVMKVRQKEDPVLIPWRQWWLFIGVADIHDNPTLFWIDPHYLDSSTGFYVTIGTNKHFVLGQPSVEENSLNFNDYPYGNPSGLVEWINGRVAYKFHKTGFDLTINVYTRDTPLLYGFTAKKEDMLLWTNNPESYFGGFDVISNFSGTLSAGNETVTFSGTGDFERSWVAVESQSANINLNKWYTWHIMWNNRVGIIIVESEDPWTGELLIETGRLTLDGKVYRMDQFQTSIYGVQGTVTDMAGNLVGSVDITRSPIRDASAFGTSFIWNGKILGERMNGYGRDEWVHNKSKF